MTIYKVRPDATDEEILAHLHDLRAAMKAFEATWQESWKARRERANELKTYDDQRTQARVLIRAARKRGLQLPPGTVLALRKGQRLSHGGKTYRVESISVTAALLKEVGKDRYLPIKDPDLARLQPIGRTWRRASPTMARASVRRSPRVQPFSSHWQEGAQSA